MCVREVETQAIVALVADKEIRAGYECDAMVDRLGEQRESVESLGAGDPQEHAAFRLCPGESSFGHVLRQCFVHDAVAFAVGCADFGDVLAVVEITQITVEYQLVEAGGMEVGSLLGDDQLVLDAFGGHDPGGTEAGATVLEKVLR